MGEREEGERERGEGRRGEREEGGRERGIEREREIITVTKRKLETTTKAATIPLVLYEYLDLV